MGVRRLCQADFTLTLALSLKGRGNIYYFKTQQKPICLQTNIHAGYRAVFF
jgi:hypothetical protein